MYVTMTDSQDKPREMNRLQSDRCVCQNLFKNHAVFRDVSLHAQETHSRPMSVVLSRGTEETSSVTDGP